MRIGRDLIVSLGLAGGGLVVAIAIGVPPLASSQVCAGIVIDDGTGAAPVPQGASVPPGSTDLNLLSAAGDTFTQNDSGLVCAINGYPASGLQSCDKASHGLFFYWSYWEGDPTTDKWTYAPVGPSEHTMEPGQSYVEGWRYQDPGPASPLAPVPSVTPAAAFAAACPTGPVGTTTTTTTTTNPPSTGGSTTSTTGRTATTTTSTVPKTTTAAGKTAESTTIEPESTVTTRPASTATTRTTQGKGGVSQAHTSDQPTSTTSPASVATKARASALGVPHRGGPPGSGGDPALPILLVVALVGIVGTGAWFWRRRP